MLQRLRRIALNQQGLTKRQTFGKGIVATELALERLGYIQIDTISVIERAHHHTLWNRVPDYRPDYLHQLIKKRTAFEYWFHAASYLPIKDFRFALPKMLSIKRGDSRYFSKLDNKNVKSVYQRIKNEGPLKARDFESDTKRKGQWWDWKPSKMALEKLFMQGDLMITARDGMEKIYDLTERVLPPHVDTNEPDLVEFAQYLVNHALTAHGFTTLKQLMHVRVGTKLRAALTAVLQQYCSESLATKLDINGMPDVFVRPSLLDEKVSTSAASVRLLSPFDNAIIHRDRVQQLFDFDYRLECYVPKDKRQYGYFCLPILYKDQLVGRVDCKAHRKEKELELVHLHLNEKNINVEIFLPLFVKEAYAFAKFNGCSSVRLSKLSPKKLTSMFEKKFNQFCI